MSWSLRDGQTGGAETNLTYDDALRATFDARRRRARAPPQRRARRPPRAPGPPAGYPSHDGWDEATAALDPVDRRRRAGARVRGRRRARLRGVRDLDGGRGRDGDRLEHRAARARPRDRRVHEGHLPRRRRPLGLGSRRRPARSPRSSPTPIARAAAAKVATRGAGRARPRRVPGRPRARRHRRAATYLGWLAFDGLAHAEGRGALEGKLGTPRRRAGDQPRRRAALPADAAARVRLRGHPEAAAAADPGRRRA